MVMKPGRLLFSVPSPYVTHDPIDGGRNLAVPVCRRKVASPWARPSVCMLLITHRSSTCVATCGNNSETQRPHSPCWANFQGVSRSNGTFFLRSSPEIGGFTKGAGSPEYFRRDGL